MLERKEVADDIVEAMFRCEPALTCGPVRFATVEQVVDGWPRHELEPRTQTSFTRRDGSKLSILSAQERERLLRSGDEVFYLAFSIEWKGPDRIEVLARGAMLSQRNVERARRGSGTGFPCGGGAYNVYRDRAGWACERTPEAAPKER